MHATAQLTVRSSQRMRCCFCLAVILFGTYHLLIGESDNKDHNCNHSTCVSVLATCLIRVASKTHELDTTVFQHRWMANSLQTLRLASKLRSAGDVPAHIALWAVENPLISSTDRLKQKVTPAFKVFCLLPAVTYCRMIATLHQPCSRA